MAQRRGATAVLLLLFSLVPPVWGQGDSSDDYLRGYAAALVRREFDISTEAVSVRDGIVTIAADVSDADLERIRHILIRIEGVREVVRADAATRPKGWTWLPGTAPFRPLFADPRWPRFGGAYVHYFGDDELGNVGVANFGEHLPMVRYSPSYGGSWDLGIQAGVFAIFDFDHSFDLINADYVAAIPVTYAKDDFAAFLRVFHQSSHLGDEYLLRGDAEERVNLSYEAVHLLLSYDLPLRLRLYGGGAYIFRIEPSDIDRWRIQTGAEWIGPSLSDRVGIRPLAAVDVQIEQEGGWTTNVAPAVGLLFERRLGRGPNFTVLAHYFNGRSPNGQFYDRDVEYVG
ncbi:MAG TPA: DUF1207 domain-containing protein, partial [Terriglobales bacterium]|nr:DUF1207 domain-containing protein [Terriglobales bacterium]